MHSHKDPLAADLVDEPGSLHEANDTWGGVADHQLHAAALQVLQSVCDMQVVFVDAGQAVV
jgi:hypothetical protein